MSAGKKWTRDELIFAINLYCKTQFGKIHIRNPDIIRLARRLGRTPGSVSYKLANFASLDPSLPRKGAVNVSALDKAVWQEFLSNLEELVFESEQFRRAVEPEESDTMDTPDAKYFPQDGETREQIIRARVNQQFFRAVVLSSYDCRCCLTGLPIAELLVASHIVPWSDDKENRLNPRNGLCLNALHDRAFDRGLISFEDDYTLIVSRRIKDYEEKDAEFLLRNAKHRMILPKRFLPDPRFLAFHRGEIFQH